MHRNFQVEISTNLISGEGLPWPTKRGHVDRYEKGILKEPSLTAERCETAEYFWLRKLWAALSSLVCPTVKQAA